MSKFSYRSALMTNVKLTLNPKAEEFVPEHIRNPPATFWDTEEQEEPEYYEYKGEKFPNSEYPVYKAFNTLRDNPVFQKKFTIFAENMLCISNSDVLKGLRFAPFWWMSGDYSSIKGQKKKFIGFYLEYKQDDITYRIAYECDDIEDPRTGWFMQWFCKNDCCGFSCDYYGCYVNYKAPKGYVNDHKLRAKQMSDSLNNLHR